MSDPRDPATGEPPPDRTADATADVGSVGEEAAKLFGALSEWARDSGDGSGGAAGLGAGLGAGWGQSLSGLAGHAASTVGELSAHVDTSAPECAFCPVCRTVHVIRTTSPEVKAHLATAASSLLQAVSEMLKTVPPPPGAPTTPYERIDLDEDDRPPDEGDDA